MSKVNMFLEDLENRLNEDEEERILKLWRDFADGRSAGIFNPVRNPVLKSKLEFPTVSVNEAILNGSFESMLLSQLKGVNDLITSTSGNIPMIRANYGSTIIPTILGCELILMDDKHNTLPGALHIEASRIRKIVSEGSIDVYAGQGRSVFECSKYFLDKFGEHPKLNKYIRIYHPDFQGVLDIAEVLYGSEIFLVFYDEPKFIKEFLTFITYAYKETANEYFRIVKPDEYYNYHYGWMHKGKLRLSLDSCVNFSAEQYEEFILEHDKDLLNTYGGIIHSCGKVDHFVSSLNKIGKGYYGFNFSQPHLNNVDKILDAALGNDINIYNLGIKEIITNKNHLIHKDPFFKMF